VVPLTSDACAQIKPGSSKLTPLPGQICAQPRPSIGTKPPTYPFASSILSKSKTPHPRTPFNKRCVQMR